MMNNNFNNGATNNNNNSNDGKGEFIMAQGTIRTMEVFAGTVKTASLSLNGYTDTIYPFESIPDNK